MNKFIVDNCVTKELELPNGEVFDGHMVPLTSASDPSLRLMFPLKREEADLINLIITNENPKEELQDTLNIFMAMASSWLATGNFLSGVILDGTENEEGVYVFLVHLMLSDNQSGLVESVMRIQFTYAIILAVLEDVPIFCSEELLQKLLDADPQAETEEQDELEELDEDPSKSETQEESSLQDDQIYKIAQQIMNEGSNNSGQKSETPPTKPKRNYVRGKKPKK